MSTPTDTSLSLALEDVFDLPGQAAPVGTDFMASLREAQQGGSLLVAQLRQAGMEPKLQVPSWTITGSVDGGSALAKPIRDNKVQYGVGLDDAGAIRRSAALNALHGFRFFHEDWLGQGCVVGAPSFAGIGLLAQQRGDLLGLTRALFGSGFSSGRSPGRVLDLSRSMYPTGEVPEVLSRAIARLFPEDDYETAAWLLGRWQGVEQAHKVLASREAAVRLKPWLENHSKDLPRHYLSLLKSAESWGTAAVQTAYRKQSEIALAFSEVFEAFDAIVTPFSQDLHYADERPGLGMVTLPVDLARLPAYIMPLGDGLGMQIIYRDLKQVAIP